jgi:hypothetical protein
LPLLNLRADLSDGIASKRCERDCKANSAGLDEIKVVVPVLPGIARSHFPHLRVGLSRQIALKGSEQGSRVNLNDLDGVFDVVSVLHDTGQSHLPGLLVFPCAKIAQKKRRHAPGGNLIVHNFP